MSTLTNELPNLPEPLWERAKAAHAATPRAYHHFGHVQELLGHLRDAAAGPGFSDPLSVLLAALFHDAVYLPGRQDNEARSADLAADLVPPLVPAANLPRVRQLILLTASHGTNSRATLAADPDAMLFLDADMAILGAPPARYDEYEAAIAEEYAGVVPAIIFRFNRRRFLSRLLAAQRLYLSDFFHARLDGPARANLRRVLER